MTSEGRSPFYRITSLRLGRSAVTSIKFHRAGENHRRARIPCHNGVTSMFWRVMITRVGTQQTGWASAADSCAGDRRSGWAATGMGGVACSGGARQREIDLEDGSLARV